MAKSPSAGSTGVPLVKALAEILNDAGLAELEYETDNVSVHLSKHGVPTVAAAVPAMPAAPAPSSAVPAAPAAPAAASDASGDGDAEAHPGAVPSPMVGTVYLSPEPGADPFINEGDSVREGQTLVIVEAMKVMNPIAAPKSGTVTRILIGNSQPVEYGQALVIIE